MERFIIEGYYEDEPQVCSDVVDAESLEEAEQIILKIRGDGYTTDGGTTLKERIDNLSKTLSQPKEEIWKELDDLAEECGNDRECIYCGKLYLVYSSYATQCEMFCSEDCETSKSEEDE